MTDYNHDRERELEETQEPIDRCHGDLYCMCDKCKKDEYEFEGGDL